MVQYKWRITGFPVDAASAAEELERIAIAAMALDTLQSALRN